MPLNIKFKDWQLLNPLKKSLTRSSGSPTAAILRQIIERRILRDFSFCRQFLLNRIFFMTDFLLFRFMTNHYEWNHWFFRSVRQFGQTVCNSNHGRMQASWKIWLHLRTLMTYPLVKPPTHMLQSLSVFPTFIFLILAMSSPTLTSSFSRLSCSSSKLTESCSIS